MKCKYCGEEGLRKKLDDNGNVISYFCPYCQDSLDLDEVKVTLEDKVKDYALTLEGIMNNPYTPEIAKDSFKKVIGDLKELMA
jgi:hypothetical protein